MKRLITHRCWTQVGTQALPDQSCSSGGCGSQAPRGQIATYNHLKRDTSAPSVTSKLVLTCGLCDV